ncbi:MAG: DUF4430 domain-containing protein [Clostridiales bacterium]|jgi:hypothetical protein|nr:DUF4430 domain-containing protein [Clostridiales bacterium]
MNIPIKNHKRKIIASVFVICALVFTFWYGGNSPGSRGWEPVKTSRATNSASVRQDSAEEQRDMRFNASADNDSYFTGPVSDGKPTPVEPQGSVVTDEARICTLSVRCDTILDKISGINPDKIELIPDDGVVFTAATVTFYEGESVFNVLQREMKQAGVPMEFVNAPIYNSAYIEGINNLYEFDCGELSGWMYKVNGWFPNYGCSRYQLKEGDVIEWVYTCDLGIDVGGHYSAKP